METINGIAQAAAKAVWGENTVDGKEPVSGQQGNVSAGEPYDKGNLEEPHSTINTTGQNTTGSTITGSSLVDRTATGGSATRDSTNDKSNYTEGASTTGHSSADRATSGTSDVNKDVEFVKTTGTAAESDNVPNNERTELKSKDTPADTSRGQADIRDPENPQTNPKNNPTDVNNTNVNNTEEGITEGQKLDGPGPKPLIEVAKEHGGDAGNTSTKATSDSASKDEKPAEDLDPNDPHAPSKGEGTGEKYVKSTGLAADGGNFDATNPGAGREADRILEEKGIHTTKAGPSKPDAEQTGEEKEKKSLKDKIKDKLHRH